MFRYSKIKNKTAMDVCKKYNSDYSVKHVNHLRISDYFFESYHIEGDIFVFPNFLQEYVFLLYC